MNTILLIIIGITLFLCIIAYYCGYRNGYAKCEKDYEKQPNTDCKAASR